MTQERIVGFFYLKIFFIIALLFIILSIFLRIGSEIVNSNFKDNSFSLLYVSKDSKIIFVDKNAKRAMFLAVGDIGNYVKGKTPFEASIALGIPINGIIIDKNFAPQNISDFTAAKNELRLLFGGDGIVLKNIDKYDIFKLINAARNTIKDNRVEVRIDLFNQDEMKNKVADGFKDSVINNMPLTIEIDNGTSIDGLGSEVALILSREGYNVISVKTVTQDTSSFIAYPQDGNILVNSLISLTNFPQKKTKVSQSADVTIFLGDDLDSMLSL